MKKILPLILALLLLLLQLYPVSATEQVQTIQLDSQKTDTGYTHSATVDGLAVPEYDYTWHIDPTTDHGQVKNSPGEYFTGTAPTGEEAVYIAHDIIYYPMLEQSKFQQVRYDGETEWVYFYEAEGYENYIFSTLPALRTGFPSQMMHTAEEAFENAVLHITQPGTYRLRGTWHGQIRIDLGDEDDVFADPSKKVTLILDGVDVECTVAPGVVFASVYECNNTWEDQDSYSHIVDTSDAGANVVISDGTVNNVSGTNVFRLLRTKYKDDDSKDTYPAQKKQYKLDAAFYAYQSMNISGGEENTGVLNIVSGNEGLDSELHLTIQGGNVNIYSQDDGINVNEDGVSVVTVNGGSLHICAGLGAEGDGIDSNGYLVINGGTVISAANPGADSGLDSDCGSFVNGGTVVALGATMDWAEADYTQNATQPVLNMRFAGSQSADEAIIITDTEGQVVFAYDPDKDEVNGSDSRTYSGAIISAPGLSIGQDYCIYIGGDVTGSEVSGIYDHLQQISFTGAVQQCYSGNSVGGFGQMGGFPGGGKNDFGGGRPEGNQPPQGFEGGRPEGNQPPQSFEGGRPEGFGGDMPSEGFAGFDGVSGATSQGMARPNANGSWGVSSGSCTYQTVFTMQTQVNAFSSVTDYRHTPTLQEDGSYLCSACGNVFADESCTTPMQADSPSASAQPDGWMIAFLVLSGCVVAAVAAIVVVFLRRKKAND